MYIALSVAMIIMLFTGEKFGDASESSKVLVGGTLLMCAILFLIILFIEMMYDRHTSNDEQHGRYNYYTGRWED